MIRPRPLTLTALVVVLLSVNEAYADDRASQLYTEAKKLATDGRYAEACPLFAESQRLEPAIGTQFNLADCYAHTAKPATALALFREVEKAAQLTGKGERQKAAAERIATLEASVPRLRVHLSEGAAATEVVILRDGAPVGEDLGRAVPVDPGAHVISATAAGRRPWERRVTILEDATPTDVEVPPLVEIARPTQPRTSPWKYVGASVGAVGVLALGTGVVFGIVAANGKSDAGCDGIDCRSAPPGSADTLRDAQSAATFSTIFVAAGAVLAAGGAAIWFLAPKKDGGATALVGLGGLRIGWTF